MKYIVFKKHSEKKNKDYYELTSVEGKEWKSLGFVDVIDRTQKKQNA